MHLLLQRSKRKILRIAYFKYGKIVLPFKSRRMLVVRLDAIGDYILFRNFIHTLKRQPEYHKYKFTLLGNIAFKTLAEEFDKGVIDDFIWISPEILLTHAGLQKLELSLKLRFKAFDLLLQPVHSRVWQIEQFIARTGAKFKICSEGDAIRIGSKEKLLEANKFYERIIPVPPTDTFEYIRNEAFVTNLLGRREQTIFSFNLKKSAPQKYIEIIVFPGAGQEFRRWSTVHFAKAVDIICEKIPDRCRIKIAGSAADTKFALEIIRYSAHKEIVEDITGKTNLPELVSIINNASFLISNETSAIHIAAAVKTMAICISNGNHFRRFNPYPKEIAPHIITMYPAEIFYDESERPGLLQRFEEQSDLDINVITPMDLCLQVFKYLKIDE